MAVGPGRINEAACSLSFDFNFDISINKTVIVAPFGKEFFLDVFGEFGIDVSKIDFVLDQDLIVSAGLQQWTIHSWYLQQGFKLALLDLLDSENFLIQDCDVFPIKLYNLFTGSIPNLKVEKVLNDQHPIRLQQAIYEQHVYKLTGLLRPDNLTFISEIMPITKTIWNECKNKIQNYTGLEWKNAVPDINKFDESKWFSEYELLGFYMKHYINNLKCNHDVQPTVNSWYDFYNGNWTETTIVKTGKFRPLKFMSSEEVSQVIEYFRTSKFG